MLCIFALTSVTGEVEFLDVFQEAYASVMRYSRAPDGFWVRSGSSDSYILGNDDVLSIVAQTYTQYSRFPTDKALSHTLKYS